MSTGPFQDECRDNGDMALGRHQRLWPSDERLRADTATWDRWQSVLRAERLRQPARSLGRLAVGTGRLAVRKLRSSPRKVREGNHADRRTIRGSYDWSGHGALAIGPTSKRFRKGLAIHRRKLSSDLVVGLEPGWLRIDPSELWWHSTSTKGEVATFVVPSRHIATIEITDLGRRRAGVTVTTTDAAELWLLIHDRRKVDAVLGNLRYGA